MTHQACVETGYGLVFGSLAAIEAVQLLLKGRARPPLGSGQGGADRALEDLRKSVVALERVLQEEEERSLLLEERVRDFEDDFKNTLSEKCAPDEKHCSCVPHLRRRIAELEAPGGMGSVHELNALIEELQPQIQEVSSERDHLAKVSELRIEEEA